MKRIIIITMIMLMLISNISFANMYETIPYPEQTEEEINQEIIDYFIKYAEHLNDTPAKRPEKADLSITIDGRNVEFPDVKPFIDNNNRTLVPLRFVAEEFGTIVNWDYKEQRVDIIAIQGSKIQFFINESTFISDGVVKQMDTQAILRNDRTMIPIRYFAEEFGLKVDFNSENNEVMLNFQ